MKTILTRLAVFAVCFGIFVAILGRGPNYSVTWNREVPAKEPFPALTEALNDPKSWPVFHHALKTVTFFDGEKPVASTTAIKPGMTAHFAIEPKEKAWKRFDIRAEVLSPKPGESFRFKLLEESTGKTTRLLDGFEWWVGVREGTPPVVFGGAEAGTKTGRSRFFGRFAPKILMNQLYQIDLVRLANLTETREKLEKEKPPAHR